MRIEALHSRTTSPFLLFIADDSPNSRAAIANLTRALAAVNLSVAAVEIVDVYEQPELAATARVLVTPSLIKRADPRQRILGDLSIPGLVMDFLQ